MRRQKVCSFFFFFKQKTAYERVSGDWSSDVCSSDRHVREAQGPRHTRCERPERERHAHELGFPTSQCRELGIRVVVLPRRISAIERGKFPLRELQGRLIDRGLTLGGFLRLDRHRAGRAGEALAASERRATLDRKST